jgi:hypothetical protein
MTSSGMEDLALIKGTLEMFCDEEKLPGQPEHFIVRGGFHGTLSEDFTLFYHKFDKNITIAENDIKSTNVDQDRSQVSNDNSSLPPTTYDGTLGKYVIVPNMRVAVYTLSVLEIITLTFFTDDLVLRLVSCPSLKYYFFCIINITGALALVCTYIHLLVLYMLKHKRFTDDWIDMLEYSQMLRALRLFRIVSGIRAGKVLAYSIRANLKDLSILCLSLIAGMCAFASCFYIAEDKKNVSSILIGWSWAVVTMTTVGYGDISPQSQVGRFIACICAMSGVLLFALTLPIFANHFVTLYQHSDARQAFKKYRGNDSSKAINDSLHTCKNEEKNYQRSF